MSVPDPAEDLPLRVRAMTSEAAFRHEQEKLGRCWTFLGFEADIAGVNDWFRTVLGGREIFVQRFETGIRAFENRCAHRFFPLRQEEKGNGPVVCGFHHWRYNADGLALGIPKCVEMYGKTPREMDARLAEVEIACHAGLIFGRWPGAQVSLSDWLGPGADILAGLFADPRLVVRPIDRAVGAHWKLLIDISLDDYHIVAVHPETFGKGGYLAPEIIRYTRFGAHSAYCPGGGEEVLEEIAAECRAGRYHPRRYRIFQFFPNLIVAHIHAMNYLGEPYWFLLVQHLTPLAHDRTRSVSRIFALPFEKQAGAIRRLARFGAMPWIAQGFRYYARKVHLEDNEACEKLQRVARQAGGAPVLAAQERRVGWMEAQYARTLTGDGCEARASDSESVTG